MLNHRLHGKNIYLLELNWLNLFLVLFFRLSGIRVHYLTATSFWSKKKQILRLNKIGVIWLNFQDSKKNNSKGFLSKINKFMEQTKVYLDQKNIFDKVSKEINLSDKEVHFVTSVITSSLYRRIRLIGELLGLAELYENNNSGKGWIWIPNDTLSKYLIEKEGGWINICPRYLTTFSLFCEGVYYVFVQILNKLKNLNQKKINILSNLGLKHSSLNLLIDKKLENYNVACFTHKGIEYGKLYTKDHYYSLDVNNPFYPSNILHLSLSKEYSILIKNSLRYFKEKNIPCDVWGNIDAITVKELILLSLFFIKKYLKTALKEIDLYLFIILFYNYIKIKINIKRLERIPKLKIVLIGYDILFPPQLALACKIKGIKTVAVQERMFSAWWSGPLIIEHYFVTGRSATQVLEKRFQDLIENKYEIGPIRLDAHYKAITKSEKLKNDLPFYKWRVLVLDFFSSTDYYENGRSVINTWKNNRKFYHDIIKLCSYFPQAHFMIKGKEYDFIKIPYFSDLVEEIEQTPNCMLIKDYEQWTPFTSVSVSDIAIALHTSLGDEMLALGKPVIFYDFFKFPSELLDYGIEVMSYTFEDLKLKLVKFFNNPDKYNQKLDSTRKKFYSVSKVTPKQMLHNQLIKIYHNQQLHSTNAYIIPADQLTDRNNVIH